VRVVLAARRLLGSAAEAAVPAEGVLFWRSFGFVSLRLMGAVVEHGVADELTRPATARQVAERLGLDADVLHRVLRALALDGVVKLHRDGRFSLTDVGRLLRGDHPESMRDWVLYLNLDSTQAAWAGIGESLRTGQPSFPLVHGRSVWAYLAEHPDQEQCFAAAMRRITRMSLRAVVGGYAWPPDGTVCDVAGGVGTLLAGILQARPRARGVLVDAPGVLEQAGGYLRSAGVGDRVEMRTGDIFTGVQARADVFVLKDVLHDWDDAASVRILETVAAAMAPGNRLVVVETPQEPDVADPIASLIDVQMLTQCDGGRQRSVAQLQSLLLSAGLRPGRVRRTSMPALVEAVR
jgi:hypothetical protein